MSVKCTEEISSAVNTTPEEKLVGFKLKTGYGSGWMFMGVTPDQVAETLKNELEGLTEYELEESGDFTIESFHITQKEIDEMPEFPGW